MHRYSRPYRRMGGGCAYRRKRKSFSFIPIVCIIITVSVLICIMPVWLICVLCGLIVGVAVTLLLCNCRY